MNHYHNYSISKKSKLNSWCLNVTRLVLSYKSELNLSTTWFFFRLLLIIHAASNLLQVGLIQIYLRSHFYWKFFNDNTETVWLHKLQLIASENSSQSSHIVNTLCLIRCLQKTRKACCIRSIIWKFTRNWIAMYATHTNSSSHINILYYLTVLCLNVKI